MSIDKLAFVDVETTGGSMYHDRIIEVGIVRVENNSVVETYQTLINPETYISPFIEQITGITNAQLSSAPTFNEVAYDILRVMDDCVFVAHNVRFDHGFLRNEFKRLDTNFAPRHFCSVKLSRLLFPEFSHHNLDSIIQRFNLDCKNRHRALDDAQVIYQFFQRVKKILPEDTLYESITTLMKKPTLPAQLDEESIENLPELPGVYIFYDTNNIPLYIGKSVNIRDRVLSHFSSDHTSTKTMNMCQQVTRIETTTTAGELGALLLESTLIKEMQPIYNRMLRSSRQVYVLTKDIHDDGYFGIKIEDLEDIQPGKLESIYGIFKSKKQAKEYLAALVKSHNLCEKLLGLEKTNSSCFSHKLGICKGACLKKESPASYNMRFTLALSQKKLKQWPFKGPILINEKNFTDNQIDTFVLDNWCLVDSYKKDSQEFPALSDLQDKIKFDYDTYKILVRYIFDKRNERNIKQLDN